MFQVHVERPSTGQMWDIVAIGDITVSKTKNEPASLTATFLRDKMTVENGDIIGVQLDEQGMDNFNLFYGYVYKTSKQLDEVTVTAYDQLYALKLSREIKVYGNIKASDLYQQMAVEHNLYILDPPNVVDTGFVIPNVVCDNKAPLDLLQEALNVTYDATGRSFYFYDFFKNLCLEDQENLIVKKEDYEINLMNLKSYTYDEDITEWINEVIVMSDDEKNTVLEVRRDQEHIDRNGRITYTERIKDGQNPSIIADYLFETKRKVIPEMDVTVYGMNPQIVPGRLIHVDLYSPSWEYVYGWFKVEDVTFTLSGGTGTMDLKLSLARMENVVFGS